MRHLSTYPRPYNYNTVRKEIKTAREYNKPILVFLKGKQSKNSISFLKRLKVKWIRFSNLTELEDKIIKSICQEIINKYRDEPQKYKDEWFEVRRKAEKIIKKALDKHLGSYFILLKKREKLENMLYVTI